MKIQADEEGMKAVKELCNIVLRTVGLDMHPFVGKILPSLEEINEKPKTDEVKSE